MKEYLVKKGEVHENGQVFKEGDKFFTEPYRAVQLGLNDGIIEEVKEPEQAEENEGDSKITSLQEELKKTTDENTRLKDDNEAKDGMIKSLQEELDKAKEETKGVTETSNQLEKDFLEKIQALEKANTELGAELQKAQGELSGAAERLAAMQAEIEELKKSKKK